MTQAQASELRSTEGAVRAQACRALATKAGEQAEQTTDPEICANFLSMKELWLKLANEIDRRLSPTHAS